MSKGASVAFPFDLEVLVREVMVKGNKCIQVQKIGERKEHQFKFEVDDFVQLFSYYYANVVNDRAYDLV